MVTYKHVNEVVRNRCVKHQANRVDSRAILLLITTSVRALIICTIKKTRQILIIKNIKAPTEVAIRRSIAL